MKAIVFGAKGTLGSELCRQLSDEQVLALDGADLDITDREKVREKILEIKPDVIFNCAAYNAVDLAELPGERDKANKLNAEAVGFIAEAAEEAGAVLVQYSTGFVFNGSKADGYNETDLPDPQSVYAKSKFAGEQQALKAPKHYVIRLNLLFGASGKSEQSKKSFPNLILDVAKEKESFDFVNDEISTPTYAPDLAEASIRLIKQNFPYGIYHLVNSGSASWYDFAREVFNLKGINVKINAVSSDKFPREAKRPANSVIINNKFPPLRDWKEALKEYLQ